MRRDDRLDATPFPPTVTLQIDDFVVTTGQTIVGRVAPSIAAVNVALVRVERAGEVSQRSKIASALADPGTGSFELAIPRLAAPTVNGGRVTVGWSVESDEHRSVHIEVHRDPNAAFDNFYESGHSPQVRAELSQRTNESIYMGAIMFILFVCGFFYIEQISRDASAFGRAAALGVVLIAALASLATSLLAIGTRWPRTISGFELVFSPDVRGPGDLVELTTSQPLPKSLRLLCIESYGELIDRGNSLEGRSMLPVMRQHTHPPIRPVPTATGCSFRLPNDAVPSVRCSAGDVMWVVRQGGMTLGPWGPFRHRDWGVVVR